MGCEQSHFFERFGSLVTEKKSNKREEFVQRKGGVRGEHRTLFLYHRSLGSFVVISRLLFVLESTVFSVTFWGLYLLKTRL